jgi:hypothetical protein
MSQHGSATWGSKEGAWGSYNGCGVLLLLLLHCNTAIAWVSARQLLCLLHGAELAAVVLVHGF